jgi:2-keto-4-pentenoate hydratase/2-oxohepta-3-ene-1,7-dioic acid hydratase in catechol pathway
LTQREIDAEQRVVIAAGLNYAAHAEEAGGGDVFLFPKPVAPGAPYGVVSTPEGVTLLDYEVELAFVLLEDVDLHALPSLETLLEQSAFFVANDLTDREPIILHKALSGPGTGFVEAKGQPGFLPAGPWLVRGTELFDAASACGGDGLRLRLDVDEGDGFRPRQDATTAAMILDPLELLARIADEVRRGGLRTPMPVRRGDEVRHYPWAVASQADGSARLPAGSVVLTGTPDGVVLQAPSALGVFARGLLRLRGPFEQFRREELARAAANEPGGYLAPGDRVRSRIDGLGAQIFSIGEPGAPPVPDPCQPAKEVSR